MRDERFEVTLRRARGYVGVASFLRSPVVALSLGGLRRRIEIALLPDNVDVNLGLDRIAPASATPGGCGSGLDHEVILITTCGRESRKTSC
jgi:hypothetical protein